MWGGGGGEGIEYGGAGYRHFDVTLKDCLVCIFYLFILNFKNLKIKN